MALQFNPGDSTGVVDEINDICNSDNNSYPLASKARRVNAALDRFYTLAFRSDGRWSFDDINHGNAPILTKNVVSGTGTYLLDTFANEIIGILRVEFTDSSGVTHTLARLNRDLITDEGLAGLSTPTGTPTQYDLIGKYIYLYPTPNATITAGLQLYVTRNKLAFTAADTTKILQVPTLFNQYICRLAALPYLIEFQKGQKNDVAAMIQSDEQEILMHFKNRAQFTQRFKVFFEDNR